MTDYKSTLNLPKTHFAMKANLAQREPSMLKQWQSDKLYEHIRQSREGCKPFILHDGPPYANGNIHIGHAVNKILKDIIIKAKTLSGYDAPYIPGWDCHGLPIEHNVEKKVGKAGVKVDVATFRKKCREYAAKQVEGQKKDFIRLGVLGEWDTPYLTMDYKTEADTIRALGKIAENGHLHKGFKPVYWSVVGGSALAEAEVEYQDKTSQSIDVKFAVADQNDFCDKVKDIGGKGEISIVIWTTTPWTLPSNQAVSINANLEYVVLQNGNERLVVADALKDAVVDRAHLDQLKIVGRFEGKVIEGIKLQHPFYDKQIPVLLGDHVTTEAGTGCVHTAPDHGADDFVVGAKYGIGTLNYVNANGVYIDDVDIFAGEHVYKVDDKVIELLRERGRLLHHESFVHSFPHCWRTKTPLIFRATPQWFISMSQNKLLDQVKACVEGVSWIPDWGRARIDSMLDSSPDWCVSRQRTWGVPICLFVHKDTQELHPNTAELIEQVAQKVEQEGIEAWFQLEPQALLGDDANHYEKVTDTLDVWFDSGVTHYSVIAQRENLSYPADLYLEGSDQHRGWFQSSLKTAIAINGKAPYKQVLTHGFTVDADGKKMSKSLGNTVSPQTVMNDLGADVLRLWVAATDFSGDMNVSDEILKRTSDSYRRIRNTARFLLSNLTGFVPSQHSVPFDQMLELDRWIVNKTASLQNEIIDAYDRYQFHFIYQKLHNFCIVELGGFYLDIIKDRQYTCKTDSLPRRSAQTALNYIAEAFARWIAPILSFTADEIWQALPASIEAAQTNNASSEGGQNRQTIFTQRWMELPQIESCQTDVTTDSTSFDDNYWSFIFDLKNAFNKAVEDKRQNNQIGKSLEADAILYCDQEALSKLSLLGDELRFVLISSTALVLPMEQAKNASAADVVDSGLEEGIKFVITKSVHDKCERCWHHREDVGQHKEHATICMRCVENIEGDGEVRLYA